MGRSKKAQEPGSGHNSILTEQEVADLEFWFERQIRAQQKKALTAKAAYDEERQQVNDLFARVKSELRTTRVKFQEMMDDADLSEAEFRAKEMERTKRYQRRGLPVGTQMALDLDGDTVTDQQMAEADGRRAGSRGDDPIPPDTIATFLHTDWLRGWHDEQAKIAERLGRAEAIIAKRDEAQSEDEAEPDEAAEPEVDLSPSAVDAKARKLKREGFLKAGTSGGEPDQAAA